MGIQRLSGDFPDFGHRLEVVVKTRTSVGAFQRAVGVSHNTYYKWVGGGMPSPTHFARICAELGLDADDWGLDDVEFARAAGVPVDDVARGGCLGFGVDFASRDTNPRVLVSQIEGAWASYYYSVSRVDAVWVCRDLVTVDSSHDDGYIPCAVKDPHFEYRGRCFALSIGGLIDWSLEKLGLLNEIVHYSTTLPERKPAVLHGTMLCTSGGVDENTQLPACTKVLMVHLGRTKDLSNRLNVPADRVGSCLREVVPAYVHPSALPSWLTTAIDNGISDKPPAAARVNGSEHPDGTSVEHLVRDLLEGASSPGGGDHRLRFD